jgi:probable F420-dependent oxidoreductase
VDLGRIGIWTFQLDLQPMAVAQETVVELEELGFGTVWIPEAVGREPFASASLLLSASRSLCVASGIASIHARSPMTMQAGWKTLSEAFPGRFLLGLGVSHQPAVEAFHGTTYDKPYSTMVSYLDAMDRGVYIAAAPADPPVRALAALGPKMLRLAADRGIGAHPYFVPVEHTASARAVLGDGPKLMPEQAVVLQADERLAREVARRHMATYLNLPNYTNNLRRLGWTDADLSGGGSDALVDAIVAWGSMEQIVDRLRAHLAAGADHVAVQVLPADARGLPLAEWRELAQATRGL